MYLVMLILVIIPVPCQTHFLPHKTLHVLCTPTLLRFKRKARTHYLFDDVKLDELMWTHESAAFSSYILSIQSTITMLPLANINILLIYSFALLRVTCVNKVN